MCQSSRCRNKTGWWATVALYTVMICAMPIPLMANDAPHRTANLPGKIFVAALLKTETLDGERFEAGILVINPNSLAVKRLRVDNALGRVRVSPDGLTLAFNNGDDVWNCDALRADNPGMMNAGTILRAWTHDGKHIVTSSETRAKKPRPRFESSLVSADGIRKSPLTVPSTDLVLDWSSDGNWLLTRSHPDRPSAQSELHLMRPDGTQQRPLKTEGLNDFGRFSPDNHRVVCSHGERGSSLKVVDLDGKTVDDVVLQQDSEGATAVCWCPNGRYVAVVVHDTSQQVVTQTEQLNYRIMVIDLDTDERRTLTPQLPDAAKAIVFGEPDWR